MESVRHGILVGSAIVFTVLMLATLIRAILGPRFTDRVVAVNMINTMVLAVIVLLALALEEDFLVDIALVYALLSFLAVVVLSKLVISRKNRQLEREKREKGVERHEPDA